MSMDIEIKTTVKIKAKSKLKHKHISLLTSYHPTSGYPDTKANKFNNPVSHMISMIPKDNVLIMGSDLNASTGMRTNEVS